MSVTAMETGAVVLEAFAVVMPPSSSNPLPVTVTGTMPEPLIAPVCDFDAGVGPAKKRGNHLNERGEFAIELRISMQCTSIDVHGVMR